MPSRSYYLHQAKVCQSLARLTDDPALRARYEELAQEFFGQLGDGEDGPWFFPAMLSKPEGGGETPLE